MFFRRFLRRASRTTTSTDKSRPAYARPLRCEPLEDRRLLSLSGGLALDGADAGAGDADPASTGILYVDDDFSADSPDGSSWTSAFANLETALARARTINTDASNDVAGIRLAAGTYVPTPLSDADPTPTGILYVDDDSSAGSPDGSSWTSAFANLEDALARARTINGDADPANNVAEIRLAAGTYIPTALSDADLDGEIDADPRSAAFSLVDGVSLYGGYAGLAPETGDGPDTRDTTRYVTTLSGDLNGDDAADIAVADLPAHISRGENAYTVVLGIDAAATLDGLVVCAGNATQTGIDVNPKESGGGVYLTGATTHVSLIDVTIRGNSANGRGAGIYSEDATLSVSNSTISANSAIRDGAGIYNEDATLAVGNSTISGNSAARWGGGIYNYSSATLTVDNSTISDNSAHDGGGIFNFDSATSTVNTSTISGNSASEYGGGILNYSATATVSNSTISDNSAYDGGGIHNEEATLSVGNSTISDNSAYDRGGGILNCFSATLTMNDSTISGNSVLGYGGTGAGIHNYDSATLTVNDSTISDNLASGARGTGGGITNDYGATLTVNNSTISGNSGGYAGGAILSEGSGTRLTVNGSTISDNIAAYGGGICCGGDVVLTNSTISGNCATGYGGYGGGVLNSGTLTIDSSTISGNSTFYYGGGINNGGTLTVNNSTISGNSVYRDGGGIYNSGTATVSKSTISGNSTDERRGAGIYNSGTVTVNDATISGNSARSYGGGILNSGTATIGNSTISGNSARSYGGGIYNFDATLTVGNSTISGNSAGVSGGGIYRVSGSRTARLHNSILAGNLLGGAASAACDASGEFDAASSHNLVGVIDGSSGLDGAGALYGTAGAPLDPRLGALADNGGPTLTHALLRGSPAIDAGNDSILPPNTPYDQRGSGFARILGPCVDIGAYEFHGLMEITLTGTENADTISIEIGATQFMVTLNGDATSYNLADYDTIYFDGGEDLNGNDQITVLCTAQDDIVALQPGLLDVDGQTYEIHASNVEVITVNAGSGGNDQVTMTGSADSNRLYSYSDYARLTDSTGSFSHRVEGFETLTVDVSGGSANSAYFYDSPDNDELTVEPGLAGFTRSAGSAAETTTTAFGFQQVYAYSTAGGDTAALTASDATQNRFYGYADYSLFTEARRSFYFYARGFDDVTATSPASLPAYAYLYDSPGVDAFSASTTSATMDRDDPWSDTIATGFARIYAYSTRGGADTAVLNGSAAGGNNYRGYPAYSTLYDSVQSFYHYVRGFHSVTAAGSKDSPSSDRAYLYDSSGDDTLVASGHSAILKDTAETKYQIEALYFDLVYARSSDGTGNDTFIEDSIVYNLIRSGVW